MVHHAVATSVDEIMLWSAISKPLCVELVSEVEVTLPDWDKSSSSSPAVE